MAITELTISPSRPERLHPCCPFIPFLGTPPTALFFVCWKNSTDATAYSPGAHFVRGSKKEKVVVQPRPANTLHEADTMVSNPEWVT